MTTKAAFEESRATKAGDFADGRSRSVANGAVERQTMTINELARVLGISRTTCYELARRQELPVRVVRLGRRLIVSRPAVMRFLNGDGRNDSPPEAG